jgi:hypothetical protein
VERWCGWSGKLTGRRGRLRAFRRIALGRGARTKSGLRSPDLGFGPEGSLASESWASGVWRRRAGHGRRMGKRPPPWPVAGDGAPRYKVCREIAVFQRFLERSDEFISWHLSDVSKPYSFCKIPHSFRPMAVRCSCGVENVREVQSNPPLPPSKPAQLVRP